MSKIILLVIDGGDFEIINKGIENGILTNFKKIKEKGAYGSLTSTIPPVTPVAWASLLTGKTPAKTGIIDFFYVKKSNSGIDVNVASKTHLKSKTLYDLLYRYGKKIISINIPFTYPPSTVKADIVISGMDTPPNRNYFRPKNLERLLKKVGYIVEPEIGYKGNKDEIIYTKYLIDSLNKRKEILMHFILKCKFDVIICFLRESDLISHALWGIEDNKYIMEVYKKIDEIIGEILEVLDNESVLFIVSDHGFSSEKYIVSLNTLFLEEGLLNLKISVKTIFKRILLFAGFEPIKGLEKTARFKFLYKILLNLQIKRKLHDMLFISLNDVDWEKTKVISYNATGPYGLVYFLKKDEKTISSIMKALNKIRPIIDKVFFIKDIYGIERDDMPDIIVKWKEGYISTHSFLRNIFTKTPKNRRGNHDLDGIIFAFGNNIKNGVTIENSKIYDILPTILSYFMIPIPKDIDGNVIKEIFKDTYNISKEKASEKERIRNTIKKLRRISK